MNISKSTVIYEFLQLLTKMEIKDTEIQCLTLKSYLQLAKEKVD